MIIFGNATISTPFDLIRLAMKTEIFACALLPRLSLSPSGNEIYFDINATYRKWWLWDITEKGT